MKTITTTTADQIGAEQLRAAMIATISMLADDVEVEPEQAALLPVSLAAAFADLSWWLGIPAPMIILHVLGEEVAA